MFKILCKLNNVEGGQNQGGEDGQLCWGPGGGGEGGKGDCLYDIRANQTRFKLDNRNINRSIV